MPSENSIYFQATGGHSHDGINSTLLDVGKYSVFDFLTGTVGSTSRVSRQIQNKTNLEEWIVRTVTAKVLEPAGLRLEANSFHGKAIAANTVNASSIVANSITANQIAANTITAAEISANTITANEIATATITGVEIAPNTVSDTNMANVRITKILSDFALFNGSIQSTTYNPGTSGWAINANGNAEFNNVTVRGTVVATGGYIGNWYITSTYLGSSTGDTILYSNGTIYGAEIITASITGSSSLTVGTYSGGASDIGIHISGGYIRGGGAGVRIMSWDGSTGTELQGNHVLTSRLQASTGAGLTNMVGAQVESTLYSTDPNVQHFDIKRGYGSGANFIRFVNYTSSSAVGAIEFNTNSSIRLVTTSDMRLKSNIKILSNTIQIVKQINPVSFEWKNDPGIYDHGFIAQDLYDIYPYPVSVGHEDVKEKPWGIDYGKLTPLLTSAIKELIERVEYLEERLRNIEGV